MLVAREMMDVARRAAIGADPAGMIHVGGEGVPGMDRLALGALVTGDEVAMLVGADGDVRQFIEKAEDGLGHGLLVKRRGGPGDDVPEHGEEGPAIHGDG